MEEQIFKPEIINDELSEKIKKVVVRKRPNLIVEIGSANGLGSTQAFIDGTVSAGILPALHCIELDADRYTELKKNITYPYAYFWHESTVSKDEYDKVEDISFMLKDGKVKTIQYGLELVLKWRDEELKKIDLIQTDGEYCLKKIFDGFLKRKKKMPCVSIALIDGSPFTGYSELKILLKNKVDVIIMDDTIDIKNWRGYNELLVNKKYMCVADNKNLRNGYAIFERKM